jgi:hypothetical protein
MIRRAERPSASEDCQCCAKLFSSARVTCQISRSSHKIDDMPNAGRADSRHVVVNVSQGSPSRGGRGRNLNDATALRASRHHESLRPRPTWN